MTASAHMTPADEMGQYWQTAIIDMAPGSIRFRGYPIQDLIGQVSFAQMIWLMLRGDLPTVGQAALLEAALTAGVDHGPQAPSIAIARMAATCGVGLNNAMASAVNVLGDVHGGAGEEAATLFFAIHAAQQNTALSKEEVIADCLQQHIKQYGKYVGGFGHRFHPVDPRAGVLLDLVRQAAQQQEVSGKFAAIAEDVGAHLAQRKGRAIPLNIDGATAVIYAELGFPPALARGLFCLSRSVGILAHAWEQMQQGGRNKGPMPRQYLPHYDGVPERQL